MKDFESLEKEFVSYNPMVFDLDSIEKTDVLGSVYDVRFSNSICFPEIKLGFHHFIHKTKDKMEVVEEFSTRKKVYLVTSLFEKNIDYKEKTDSGVDFTSIDQGVKSLIKSIKPDFPPLLNRAFLKMWEMLVEFDLIPETDNFVSSHLAEGPGSFIQATILFRELQEKLGKIKSASKDNYYGITLHSDHEHLLMHQEFIKYFSKESRNRLHIMETKSIDELRDLYGGGKSLATAPITNGDLTKLNTIRQFAGSTGEKGTKEKNVEAFAKPSDLITSDGGFDWKRENLQEQEAYKLVFGEILTALKLQKDGGNFVIKFFETYTKNTVKLIQMLRQIYTKVYLAKPYTSRISNSEKYIVCKGFNKSTISSKIISKLEEMLEVMNRNSQYQILDMFTEITLSDNVYKSFRQINSELLVKQYVGINNIIKFINLDNYNGIEFNEYLDKQIVVAHFWNNLFLEPKLFNKIIKYFKTFDFIKYKKDVLSNKEDNQSMISVNSVNSEPETNYELETKSTKTKLSRTKSIKSKSVKPTTKSKTTKQVKRSKSNQKGGGLNSYSYSDSDSDMGIEIYDNISMSINSSDEVIGHLESDNENSDRIDLNKL
jgi:23S rRNA U2552 (ribose-2'-O)-methylase RlmE/FtsJ